MDYMTNIAGKIGSLYLNSISCNKINFRYIKKINVKKDNVIIKYKWIFT